MFSTRKLMTMVAFMAALFMYSCSDDDGGSSSGLDVRGIWAPVGAGAYYSTAVNEPTQFLSIQADETCADCGQIGGHVIGIAFLQNAFTPDDPQWTCINDSSENFKQGVAEFNGYVEGRTITGGLLATVRTSGGNRPCRNRPNPLGNCYDALHDPPQPIPVPSNLYEMFVRTDIVATIEWLPDETFFAPGLCVMNGTFVKAGDPRGPQFDAIPPACSTEGSFTFYRSVSNLPPSCPPGDSQCSLDPAALFFPLPMTEEECLSPASAP